MAGSSFACLVRGELRKVVFQGVNWAVPVAAVGVGAVAGSAAGEVATGLEPFQAAIDTYRAFAAAAVGVVMLAVSARLAAVEYQEGTIRVLLARGVGRLRLLLAKVVAVAVVALPVLALVTIAGLIEVPVRLRGQAAPVVWSEVWVAALTVALSAAACGLLGVAAGAVGRSMTFAMAVAAGFFPLDNFLGYVLPVLQNATQERVWSDVTTYLLGPTLNHLPAVLMGRHAGELVPPQLPVDAAHSLLVVAGYAVTVSAAAAMMVWRRDTLE
jgi:hypothetical protein